MVVEGLSSATLRSDLCVSLTVLWAPVPTLLLLANDRFKVCKPAESPLQPRQNKRCSQDTVERFWLRYKDTLLNSNFWDSGGAGRKCCVQKKGLGGRKMTWLCASGWVFPPDLHRGADHLPKPSPAGSDGEQAAA